MARTTNELHLNFEEDVIFYEVEQDESVNLDELPQEALDEIEAKNTQFLAEVVEPEIMKTFSICPCNMNDFVARNEQKRKTNAMLGVDFEPTIIQEDVDKYRYAIIVISNRGIMTGVSCYMRECKNCHKIEYWGDVEVFAHLLAEITTNFVTMKQDTSAEDVILDIDADSENPLGPNAVLTDIPEMNTSDLEVVDIVEEECGETPYGPEE